MTSFTLTPTSMVLPILVPGWCCLACGQAGNNRHACAGVQLIRQPLRARYRTETWWITAKRSGKVWTSSRWFWQEQRWSKLRLAETYDKTESDSRRPRILGGSKRRSSNRSKCGRRRMDLVLKPYLDLRWGAYSTVELDWSNGGRPVKKTLFTKWRLSQTGVIPLFLKSTKLWQLLNGNLPGLLGGLIARHRTHTFKLQFP